VANTDNINLNKPNRGSLDWDVPLNENFDLLDLYISKEIFTDASANSSGMNDTFDTATLDEKWSEFNATYLTITPSIYSNLHMQVSADHVGLCGITQPIAYSSFTVTAKITTVPTFPGGAVANKSGGIMLLEGLGADDDKFMLGNDARWLDGQIVYGLTSNTAASQLDYIYPPMLNIKYYKIVVDPTNWTAYVSPNGVQWLHCREGTLTPYIASFTPTYVGISLWSPGSEGIGLMCDWFKVEEN